MCNRKDLGRQWLLDRCREVQANPNDHLDLWAREHYKSSIITFGMTVQDILNNPEITVGIFSHTRPNSKGFLRQIKREFESNELLKSLFPDILWQAPHKESPKWSEDDGLIVRRKTNPKESTIEAHGLVDGMPTGKHYSLLVYDDVVTKESVTSPDMMAKTTEALEISFNLGADGGHRRFIGTRYHFADSYKTVIDRGTATIRLHNGTVDNCGDIAQPVLWTPEKMIEKRRDMGIYTFSCQILQDPVADKAQGFREEWIKYYKNGDGEGMNRYLIVDPANEKKRSSDYTAIGVIGLGYDNNYYLLDFVYDRLNLTERTTELFRLHRKWKPKGVGYEKYGKDSDIQHIQHVQETSNYRFDIIELGGSTPKNDRIRRLVPVFEQGRFYFPETCYRTTWEGRLVEQINQFIQEEYKAFPVGLHDDAMDMLARILDDSMMTVWPKLEETDDRYKRKRRQVGTAWAR